MGLFGSSAAEKQNKLLLEVDRRRLERMQRLEQELDAAKKELAQAKSVLAELDALKAHNQQLTEWSIAYSLWGQELNNLLRETQLKETERKDAAQKLSEKGNPAWML